MRRGVFPIGDRVRVTNYGPFRGLRGAIRAVDMLADDQEESCCFYLVALEGIAELAPIWFEYQDVEPVVSPFVAPQLAD